MFGVSQNNRRPNAIHWFAKASGSPKPAKGASNVHSNFPFQLHGMEDREHRLYKLGYA